MEVVGVGEAMTKEGWALRFLLRLVLALHEKQDGVNESIHTQVDDFSVLLSGGMTMLEFANKYPEYDMEKPPGEGWVLDKNQQWRLLDSRGKYI